ncbi:hypothetical protein HPP92_024252 [Vanilla planifolia]|uniref:4-coumarate--CoA ligase n=1 Tax=Vanilla planifolia TaxID=51239 RepID=A0A835PRN3_VANPL|nr:hypothetical protein HPP92_024252 [Vanilla planifolia]
MLRWSGEKTKLFAIWNREEDGRVLSQGGGVDRGNKEDIVYYNGGGSGEMGSGKERGRRRAELEENVCRAEFRFLPTVSSLFSDPYLVGDSPRDYHSLIASSQVRRRKLFSLSVFAFSACRFPNHITISDFVRASPNILMEVVKATLKRASAAHDSVAIRAENNCYSYTQLVSTACNICDQLCSSNLSNTECRDRTSLHTNTESKNLHGARVGILARPSAEFVAGILGTWLSGGVAVPLALSYPETELLHVMNDSDISIVLSTQEHQELMEKVTSKCEDPALILYTSGTTGKPKGVVHTHKGILSQVEFLPKFSVRGVWQRWRESYPADGSKSDNAITLFTGVPTMYTRLLQGYETMEPDLKTASAFAASQLRLMMCGSSALPYPVMKHWEEITGHRLLERYGMTEFVMALSNPLHGTRKAGTVGQPLPRVEVKIVGEDGTISDGVGELCVRSPSQFKEYWKQPKVTQESFIDGGFFKTGDTVMVDEDGYYIILGRSNADIMKVGGYKLSALEIEAVILEHPSVSECCILGMQDEDYGEVVCAIIVPVEDVKKVIGLEELQKWSKERLAPYKIPTKLFIWDAIPRNAMGKVNKKELKKLLQH